jgi:hypothetical protein
VRRQAGVAIIEPDHLQAAGDEPGTEAVGPAEQLGADPHHQQYGRRLEVAEALVRHLDDRRPAIQGLFFAHVIPS